MKLKNLGIAAAVIGSIAAGVMAYKNRMYLSDNHKDTKK